MLFPFRHPSLTVSRLQTLGLGVGNPKVGKARLGVISVPSVANVFLAAAAAIAFVFGDAIVDWYVRYLNGL